MSKVAQRDGPTALSRLAGEGGELALHQPFSSLSIDSELSNISANIVEDICPVCSSGSYLNQNLKFKLNPECYHKMCENCVNRVFRNGPALCPYQGCSKTLRFNRFRDLTFEDVRIEKEVDIRRRICKIFNKREEDFETMRDYNNYLNQVEDITFDLINGENVEQRNREIAAYQDREARSIAENAELSAQESQSFRARQAYEKEQAKLRKDAAAREEQEEKREKVEGQMDYLRKLQSSDGGARKIAGERERERLRKAQARKQASDGALNAAPSDFTFAGLKQKTAPEPEKPYDPFDGISMEKKYFVLQKDYNWDWLDQGKKPLWTAGGYDMTEYCGRALTEAFAGLAVFVGEETADREKKADQSVATQGAAAVADDVF